MQIATIEYAPVLSLFFFFPTYNTYTKLLPNPTQLRPRIPKQETDWACRYPEDSADSVAAFQQIP